MDLKKIPLIQMLYDGLDYQTKTMVGPFVMGHPQVKPPTMHVYF